VKTTARAASHPDPVSPEAAAIAASEDCDRLAHALAIALEDRAVALRALLKAGKPRPPIIRQLHRRSVDGALFAAGVAAYATVEHVFAVGRRTFTQQLRSAIASEED